MVTAESATRHRPEERGTQVALPRVAAQVSGRISPYGGEMSFLAWIVIGLIAGAIAKAIMPGNDPGGIIVTMIIGIVGAVIGGFLGSTLMGLPLTGFSLQSLLLAVVGALILLWIYRMATRGRTRVP
jgi:uncharacterized membrane protein YeaQ/YmgE (transglycosylase-associated protein family)